MQIKNIFKAYGDNVVFNNFNLEIPDNKITCILGASGCGKTTLLNIISDLTQYKGEIICQDKSFSYIFQNTRLLNNLTVYENLQYVLKNSDIEKINVMLDKVGLSIAKNKYPLQLSGGMAQRVSLCRAFLYPSAVLLMDEPFKGLDISLKKQVITVFKELYAEDHRTTIFITHDIEEGLLLADKLVVLGDKGEILVEENIFIRNEANIQVLRNKIFAVI